MFLKMTRGGFGGVNHIEGGAEPEIDVKADGIRSMFHGELSQLRRTIRFHIEVYRSLV